MASRVVLHVGLMKSGTSYLQRRLGANRSLLGERGVLFPGEVWRDQVLAVGDVLGRAQTGAAAAGRWAALVAETAAHYGDAIVSMEFLGPAPPEKIAAVVASFGETPVEAVVTVRDLGRGVPAMWQENLQNGGTVDWPDYVQLLPGKRRPARAFWRQQGMGRIVDNWVDALGPDRVSLVTVPPAGGPAGLLWTRFCAAARVDARDTAEVPRANPSLDAASALVLLDLNRRLAADDLGTRAYHARVKFGLAKRAMAGRGGDPIGFVPPRWLVERSAEIVGRLGGSGAAVVGDLSDLVPAEVPGVDPHQVTVEERLEAAVDALRQVALAPPRQSRRRREADVLG